jgi:hypothetical protein
MSSPSEEAWATCLYIGLFVVFGLIYIFTESERVAIDFTLRINETANLTLSV